MSRWKQVKRSLFTSLFPIDSQIYYSKEGATYIIYSTKNFLAVKTDLWYSKGCPLLFIIPYVPLRLTPIDSSKQCRSSRKNKV